MPNRSLDDFTGGDAGSDGGDDSTAESPSEEPPESVDGNPAEPTDEPADETEDPTLTVEEATPTYDFSPDGSTCEACGETVETRWHAAEVGMVCVDCKGW